LATHDDDHGDSDSRARGEQSRRILAAARRLIADRGIYRSHVKDIAREAGYSAGVVTYHYGTKNALLGDVLEADAVVRLERLHELVGAATTLDELVKGLAMTLGDVMTSGEGGAIASLEFAVLASRDEQLGARQAAVRRTYRQELAGILEDKQRAGLIVLRDDPASIAAVLVALGQGLVSEALADRDWDHGAAVRCATARMRELLSP
jgi:AcrR family transcriptional regulator